MSLCQNRLQEERYVPGRGIDAMPWQLTQALLPGSSGVAIILLDSLLSLRGRRRAF